MPLAVINFLDEHGRPIDPGYGRPGGGGNYPTQGPVYPGGYPTPGPIYPGGHPGGGPVYPPQYPSQGPVYPGGPVDPGYGHPGQPGHPTHPEYPVVPGVPDNSLPVPPGEIGQLPVPPPQYANKIVVAVYRPSQGWYCRTYEPGAGHPDQGLPGQPGHPSTGPVPGQPPRPDQGLPPMPQPRR
jgi:hypothetical protein